MSSAISTILDLIKNLKIFNFLLRLIKYPGLDNIIVVRRFPLRKVLRAHQLGLTFGLFLTILITCFHYKPIFNVLHLYLAPLLVSIFIIGTLWISPYLLIVFLYWYFFKEVTGEWSAAWMLSQWYLGGYIFGAILSILYNDLVLACLLIFNKDRVKIAFAFNTDKRLNIIKSPIEAEELDLFNLLKPMTYYIHNLRNSIATGLIKYNTQKIESLIRKAVKKMPDSGADFKKLLKLLNCDSSKQFEDGMKKLVDQLMKKDEQTINKVERDFEPLVEKYLQLRKPKLYNYRVNTDDLHPYTIAFVANPRIFLGKGEYETDPIMNDRNLFLRSVEKALFSFESNEVFGRPEIWSRVRVIAIFDKRINFALTQPLHSGLQLDDIIAENLTAPSDGIWDDYQAIILGAQNIDGVALAVLNEIINETDVIFALTASNKYTRSTAIASDYRDIQNPCQCANNFQFHLNPEDTKIGEIIVPTCAQPKGLFESEHEGFKEEIPGLVALNVIDANLKSYIHEFAHAMSSFYHGFIVDEYFDKMQVLDDLTNGNKPILSGDFIPVYINRIERVEPTDKTVIPVHKIFADYQSVRYYSDREHPSAEGNWIGYFPDRKTPDVFCTMDRTYGDYRFDQLICDFMYDRLIKKINR